MNTPALEHQLMTYKLRLSGIIEESISNGPGLRLVVFAQGCKHHCAGCHNPSSHDFEGGYDLSIGELLKLMAENPLLDGITLSGGDPFEQALGFGLLAKAARASGYHVTTYTGYTFEQLLNRRQVSPEIGLLLEETDLLIDGPFQIACKNELLLFRGSENQRLIDVKQSLALEAVITIG